ncbi:MAG: malate dehydrogenase [Rhodobacteraceae bacterium]|nr:malate dehydrogenase [Paracoccaceae bacterium]
MGRVIGGEVIEDARRRGRVVLEVLPGDIVTSLARETALRLGILLADGPIEKPAPVKTDGPTAARRVLYKRSARWVAPGKGPHHRGRRFTKIACVGAGGVGSNVAHLVATAHLADEIMLIDIAPGLAAATAMDLNHTAGITGVGTRCNGGEDLSLVAGADVVVVTAGQARRPGMTRADLINVNGRVIGQAAEAIRTQAPDAVVIVVTNPLDEMTVKMLRATGFPHGRVLGMAGTLDSGRFRTALAAAAGVTPADVQAITLGSHGDEMVPITSRARIRGRPLDVWLPQDQIDACVKEAVIGGGQVVALKKRGSATIAPAHAAVELLDYMRGARQGPVPVSVMLNGEYGIRDVVLGMPANLGMSGLLSVEEMRLTPAETKALHAAAAAVRTRLEI